MARIVEYYWYVATIFLLQLFSARLINAFSSILFAGTVLATSAEDGLLSLYRKDFSGSWINVQTLPSRAEPTKAFFKNS
jgi:hypothetical protein